MTHPEGPEYSGLDLQFVDPAIRPQDDLYRHVNGKWLAEHTIPEDRSIDGAFLALRDKSQEQVRQLIEENQAGEHASTIYAAMMDTDTINEAGIAPISPLLEQIAAAQDKQQLSKLMGKLDRNAIGGLFGGYVNNDARDSETYVFYFVQVGLGLPDESYYRDETYQPVLDKYAGMLADLARAANLSGDANTTASQIIEFEKNLASHHLSVVDRRDVDKTYNAMTMEELVDSAPGFGWDDWLEQVGLTPQRVSKVVVSNPHYMTQAAALWKATDIGLLKSWMALKVLSAHAPLLSDEFVSIHFDFFGTVLSGTPENRPRWKRAVSLAESLVGEEIGRHYVEKHFPSENKQRMQQLVENLIEAYRVRIKQLPWMSAETRVKALEKLESFTPKIGYPDTWRDFSTLQCTEGGLVAMVGAAHEFNHDHEIAKLDGPVDRSEWHMTPQTVNAYYNPVMNEIVFPAAILQAPFFSMDADDAVNYGAIGAVIGHEIGHGFDDQGSKYDGHGNLVDWWSDADREEFSVRTSALIDQFQGLTPRGLDEEKDHVNGAFTVGENIGDLGGLSIALVAYKLARAQNPESTRGGLTPIQRLFYSWAVVWRTVTRPEEAVMRLATDPHSPPEFRCNTIVSNIDEFHEQFATTDTDEMWREKSNRVSIW